MLKPHPQADPTRIQALAGVQRIVIKVGSNLVLQEGHAGKSPWLTGFVRDIVRLHKAGFEVVLVSSGAIGTGMRALEMPKRPGSLPLQQACAAVGQSRLMHQYQKLFARHGLHVGQVLLTVEDLKDRQRYFNLRHTVRSLLAVRAIPIINENDSIAVEEIKVGDNDSLSAHVTNFVQADLLVILTDIDGLFRGDPHKNPDAEMLYRVSRITPEIHGYAGKKGSEAATGGMRTKLTAAQIVTRSGEMMLIANGRDERVSDLLKGKLAGTLFVPSRSRLSSRKRWIAFARKPAGSILVDAGGANAVMARQKSLLPAGTRAVEGFFRKGDVVEIRTLGRRLIGQGISNYSSDDIRRIRGCKTSEILPILGRKDYEEIIHRDNLALVEENPPTTSPKRGGA